MGAFFRENVTLHQATSNSHIFDRCGPLQGYEGAMGARSESVPPLKPQKTGQPCD